MYSSAHTEWTASGPWGVIWVRIADGTFNSRPVLWWVSVRFSWTHLQFWWECLNTPIYFPIICCHQCAVKYTTYLFYFLLLRCLLSPLCLTQPSNVPMGIIHACIISVSTRVRFKGQLAPGPAGSDSPFSNSWVCPGVSFSQQVLPGIPIETLQR